MQKQLPHELPTTNSDVPAAIPLAEIPDTENCSAEPSVNAVYKYLMYSVSLPERALRSTSAMVGGVLKESAELLVPQAFQTSKSYSIFVSQMLGIMTESIGGVENKSNVESPTGVENFVARKAVGNFMELAGMATLHLSPITVLALVSDIAYGSKTYLNELAEELKREGVIDENSSIYNAADLLEAVQNASGVTAEAFDLPPISVDGLRETIEQTRTAVNRMNPAKMIPQNELQHLWTDMQEMALKENVSVFEVSSAMSLYTLNQVTTVGKGALSTIKVAGNMFDKHIFQHYVDSMIDLHDKGLYGSLAESSKPYLDAVWNNFSTDRETVTEDVLSGKMVGRFWNGLRGWFSKAEEEEEELDVTAEASSEQPEKPDQTTE
jgi:hypothetical protein